MLNNGNKAEKAEKEKSQKTITCPISEITMKVDLCPVISCMWNVEGNCKGGESVQAINLAFDKGLTLQEAKEKIKKAESKIQRGLILDSYIEFVKDNNLINEKHGRRKDMKAVCAKTKSFAWDKTFKVDVATFVALCSNKNFKAFSKKKGINVSLTSILGIRGIHRDAIRACLGKRNTEMVKKYKVKVKPKSKNRGNQNVV